MALKCACGGIFKLISSSDIIWDQFRKPPKKIVECQNCFYVLRMNGLEAAIFKLKERNKYLTVK